MQLAVLRAEKDASIRAHGRRAGHRARGAILPLQPPLGVHAGNRLVRVGDNDRAVRRQGGRQVGAKAARKRPTRRAVRVQCVKPPVRRPETDGAVRRNRRRAEVTVIPVRDRELPFLRQVRPERIEPSVGGAEIDRAAGALDRRTPRRTIRTKIADQLSGHRDTPRTGSRFTELSVARAIGRSNPIKKVRARNGGLVVVKGLRGNGVSNPNRRVGIVHGVTPHLVKPGAGRGVPAHAHPIVVGPFSRCHV